MDGWLACIDSNKSFYVSVQVIVSFIQFSRVFSRVFRNFFVSLCSCLFNKYVTQLEFQRESPWVSWHARCGCGCNAIHEQSINLLLHTLTTYHHIVFFNIKMFAHEEAIRSTSLKWFFSPSPSPSLSFSHGVLFYSRFRLIFEHIFRGIATLWLNKILCPIVIVSWCSFNFRCSVCRVFFL